jgi:K+/H+ antiporter YhaU regulatory subunit KhtT
VAIWKDEIIILTPGPKSADSNLTMEVIGEAKKYRGPVHECYLRGIVLEC